MIFIDNAIVLLRANTRETDRAVCVYSMDHGRINLNFRGVNRPQGKLKALSEPLACAQYRISWRPGSPAGVAAGGKLIAVFPGVRADYAKLSLALHFCELFYRLTPPAQPNRQKYELLFGALSHLDGNAPSRVFRQAFTLRLMELAGFGLASRPVLGMDASYWRALHEADFSALVFPSEMEAEYLGRTDMVLRRFFAAQLDRPMRTMP